MKRTLLVVGAVALTLVTAGTMYAIRSITTPPPAANASGSTTELFPITAPPSPDEIANGARTVVPAGTTLMLQLQTRLSTRTSNMGDPFHATVVTPVYVEGRIAIPAGAMLSGHLILVRKPDSFDGSGALQLMYDELVSAGHAYTLGTRSEIYVGKAGPECELTAGDALEASLDEALHVRRS